MFVDYMQLIANRRLKALGMKFRYRSSKNPFPWLSETIDLDKQKNFFESKVIEYQNAGALADDF
jgi:ribonucleoside-diphosphate reductase beta chain